MQAYFRLTKLNVSDSPIIINMDVHPVRLMVRRCHVTWLDDSVCVREIFLCKRSLVCGTIRELLAHQFVDPFIVATSAEGGLDSWDDERHVRSFEDNFRCDKVLKYCDSEEISWVVDVKKGDTQISYLEERY